MHGSDRAAACRSTGINIFIAAHHGLTEAGGWIRLAAPTEAVMRTLQIVVVDAGIDCRKTLRQALRIWPDLRTGHAPPDRSS
jgi:stage II sporulation protein AA (anti-sigma F factor antagonist)